MMLVDMPGDPLDVDALDVPPCPRCGSSAYEFDRDYQAFVCDDCGLWVDKT